MATIEDSVIGYFRSAVCSGQPIRGSIVDRSLFAENGMLCHMDSARRPQTRMNPGWL